MTDADKIFRIMLSARGAENAITARDIAIEIGWSSGMEREVRRIIAAWDHIIVCAKLRGRGDEGGYFIPQTYQEIEAYWAHLSDLASKAEAKVQRFEQACAKAGFNLRHTLDRRGDKAA